MMQVIFFPNGNTACFDDRGEQVPELQQSWLKMYVKFLIKHKIDPTTVDFMMPNGDNAEIFKGAGGFNWRIK